MLQARSLKPEDSAEQGNYEKTELPRQDKQPEGMKEKFTDKTTPKTDCLVGASAPPQVKYCSTETSEKCSNSLVRVLKLLLNLDAMIDATPLQRVCMTSAAQNYVISL